ncbi:MAG: nucleotidyltransferase domain-containing protein [Thermoguttaceae bacterium]|jgi:predicted nucleotidyltransferase
MRKSSPIDALISKTTQGLLAATVLQPQRSWYLSDLAKHLGRRPSSLQKPLAALVSAGILCRRKDGNRVYFQADPACPFLDELQGIIAKTVGLIDVLREALLPLAPDITAAFVHGSVAKSLERASSDIDLIVIGSLGLSKLSPVLEAVEEHLGRPINASVYSPQEFSKKIKAKNHFLHAVLEK